MSVTKKIVVIFVICTLLGLVAQANAQGLFGGKTFSERLDNFGRTIFGSGPTEENASPSEKPSTQANPKKSSSEDASPDTRAPRAGSIMGSPGTAKENPGSRDSSTPAPANRIERYNTNAQPVARSPVAPPSTTDRPYRSLPDSSILDDEKLPNATAAKPKPDIGGASQPAGEPGQVAAPRNRAPQRTQITDYGPSPSQPIQNRLMQSRISAFKTPAPAAQHPADQRPADQPTIANQPTPAKRPVLDSPPKVAGQPTLAKRPGASDKSGQPTVAQRNPPSVRSEDGDGMGTKIPRADSAPNPIRAANPAVRAKAPVASAKEDALLFTRRGPVLSVETLGPRKIIVGKESTYEVALSNAGEVAAEEVIVFVSLPDWAEVAHAEASSGTPQFAAAGQAGVPFQWKVGRLEAKSREKLAVRIIPRQSKPFDLAVRWDYKPVASQAMIEVQEPKLEMQLNGPRDVFYGKKETYRLKMTNTGTGNAEGVVVKLLPVGSGENAPVMYQVGMLPAGESKNIDIELTARQVGDLSIQVEARGEAGLHAELAERVLVRRAGLEVVAEGPKLQYVGSTCTYLVRVRNPGNAPALNIRFDAALPAGMKYVGGIEGARTDAAGVKLQWILESLNPQLEQVYTLKCRLGTAGTARLDISAAAEDELSTVAGVNTQVDAAASLTLDVQDPPGPVSLGEESVYEVRIRNRGTKVAEGVEVLSYFSRGIEPTAAEGGPNRIGPGQVAFAPLATLAPGAEAIFKVRAKAETAGNHVFRAEVHCKAMGTRLISEKNTLYYQDSVTQDTPEAGVPVEANRNSAPPETYRTQRR